MILVLRLGQTGKLHMDLAEEVVDTHWNIKRNFKKDTDTVPYTKELLIIGLKYYMSSPYKVGRNKENKFPPGKIKFLSYINM